MRILIRMSAHVLRYETSPWSLLHGSASTIIIICLLHYKHRSYLLYGVPHRSRSRCRRRSLHRLVCAITTSIILLSSSAASRADFTCPAVEDKNSWSRAPSTSPAGARFVSSSIVVVVRTARSGQARLFRATSGRPANRFSAAAAVYNIIQRRFVVASTDRRHLFSAACPSTRGRQKNVKWVCFPRKTKIWKTRSAPIILLLLLLHNDTTVRPQTKRMSCTSYITHENARCRSLML